MRPYRPVGWARCALPPNAATTSRGKKKDMPALRLGLAVLLAAATLPACGSSDDDTDTRPQTTVAGDQRGVLETIDALQRASRRGDARKICSQVFTPELARSIRKASKTSCAAEVRMRLFRPDESISVERAIKVQGNAATVVIREQNGDVSTLHMLKRAGGWRIGRVTPRAGGAP